MNIGFDASRAFIDKKTGTENYSYQLLKHLQKVDQKNKYFIYARNTPDVKVKEKNTSGVFILPYPRFWTQMGLALQTFKDPLDILFVPAHTLPLVRKPGLKTVVTVHDLGAEYLPSTHQLKQRLYLKLMTKYQLETATHLIAVSEATKSDLVKKLGIPVEKISVVYEGYDRDKFKIQNSKFKIDQSIKKYNLMYHDYFLFVGTIQPRKNLERLIRAYALVLKRGVTGVGAPRRVPAAKLLRARTSDGGNARQDPEQIKLVLAGSKGWLADSIYQLPKELGIEDQVKFLGYVPDKDLPALYCGAIAFLFPSLFEGFGLPILEAMACGCPVLTSNISSMPEIAGKAAILVDPYSVEDITRGIGRIQSASWRKELRIKLADAGLEQVKNFSWEKAGKETLEILEKTANSSLNS